MDHHRQARQIAGVFQHAEEAMKNVVTTGSTMAMA